jgi:hypothetical protein
MLAIQIVNAALVIGYFNSPQIRSIFEASGQFKDRTGLPFILIAGFLAGSALPELAKIATGKVKALDQAWRSKTLFTGFVYAFVALLVQGLYFVQVALFGDSGSLPSTVAKVAFDMLVFSPFLSIPFATGLFRWHASQFKPSSFTQVYTKTGYAQFVLPGLILCWAFWTPVMSAIYTLPMRLQFPIAMLCEAAWAILFVFNVDQKAQDSAVLAE